MRKLLLVLFLFALTSNALAKVEMWKCKLVFLEDISDLSNFSTYFYKIDTEKLTVDQRLKGKWAPYLPSNRTEEMEYDKENDSLFIFGEPDGKNELLIFDLVENTIFEYRKKDDTFGDFFKKEKCDEIE